jgi:hypothetical protein
MKDWILWASLALNVIFIFGKLRDRWYQGVIDDYLKEPDGTDEKVKKAIYNPKPLRKKRDHA